MKQGFFLLIILILNACTNWTGDSLDTQDKSFVDRNLPGKWETNFHKGAYLYTSQKNSIRFENGRYTITEYTYEDTNEDGLPDNPDAPYAIFKLSGTFTSEHRTNQTIDIKNINFHQDSGKLTILLDATWANTEKVYGFTDWEAGVEKDITNIEDFSINDFSTIKKETIYNIYSINNNSLYTGVYESRTVQNRPNEFDHLVFYKKDKPVLLKDSNLTCKWESNYYPINLHEIARKKLIFKNNNFTEIEEIYYDIDLDGNPDGTVAATMIRKGLYSTRKPMNYPDSLEKEIDFHLLSVKLAFHTKETLDYANNINIYGYSDWKLNLYKEVIGHNDPSERKLPCYKPSIEYSIYFQNGDKLYLGADPGYKTENRSPGLSSIIYKPSDKSYIPNNVSINSITPEVDHTTHELVFNIDYSFQINPNIYNESDKYDIYLVITDLKDETFYLSTCIENITFQEMHNQTAQIKVSLLQFDKSKTDLNLTYYLTVNNQDCIYLEQFHNFKISTDLFNNHNPGSIINCSLQ